MAQSALRALLQGGPAPAGMASAQTAIQNAAQRPQPKPMGQQVADVLGGVALPLSAVPFVGDIAGLGADAAMYANYPEERTALNYGLSLAGVLPFVPSAAGIRTAGEAAESALDMSQAARMQRAGEQGFDVSSVSYRGLSQPYNPSKAGYYQMFTSNPQEAGEYAMSNPAGNANVIPAYLRKGNALSIDAGGRNFNAIGVESLPDSIRSNLHPSITSVARTDDIAHAAKAAGYDSVTINNVYDNAAGETAIGKNQGSKNELTADQILQELGFSLENMGPSIPASDNYNPPIKRNPVTITAVFDPSNIRSVNAAFDPTKRNSANLMAGVMGGAVGLSALRQLMPQQEQE